MTWGQVSKVIRDMRVSDAAALTDGQLLEFFLARREEAAFEELVRRHGPMVVGVCRRVLKNAHDVEDVFQATFLVLVRKAASLRLRSTLGNWLYGVAYHTALKARAANGTRRAKEAKVSTMPRIESPAEDNWQEVQPILDRELTRLPLRYREAVVLCDLEGKTRKEAARQLGVPEGTLSGRLTTARRMLARRLARYGLMTTAGALAAVLLRGVASASVPPPMTLSTIQAACLFASGQAATTGMVSARVVVLTEGVLKTMLLNKLKTVTVGLLLVALLGVGGGYLACRAWAASPRAETSPKPKADRPARADRTKDSLPTQGSLRLGTDRFRHGTPIDSLSVSADGKFAATTNEGHWLGSTRVFDLSDGREVLVSGRNSWIGEAVALSPDGKLLASKEHQAVVLREVPTGNEVRRLTPPEAGMGGTITYWVAFTPDAKAVAATSTGKVIHLMDVETGQLIRSFTHDKVVYACAFSPDGKLMAAGGYDLNDNSSYFIRLWEVATGKELRRFLGNKSGVRSVMFSPDGKAVIAGGDDAQLRLWDVNTGELKQTWPEIGFRIRSVAFAPDAKTVAAAGDAIHLYDVGSGKERLHIARTARGLHFSPDGKELIGAVGGAIYRWDTANGRALTPEAAHDSSLEAIMPTPDGKRLLTLDSVGVVNLWDTGTGKHLRRIQARGSRPVALSPDGRYLVWPIEDESFTYSAPGKPDSLRTGSQLRLYDLAADKIVDRFAPYKGDAWSMAFTPAGKVLVTVDHRDAIVRLWDVETGKEQRTFSVVRKEETMEHFVRGAVLSPDGKTLVVSYNRADNTTILYAAVVVRLWDVATGKELHELTGHTNYVEGLAFSSDGRFLATAGEHGLGNSVHVWDVASGKRVPSLGHGLEIGAGSVAFSPDGRTLATASADGVIRVWEMATWKVRAELKGHRDRVTTLTFAPDGRLFSGGLDTTVLAWNLRPGRDAADKPFTVAWDDLTGVDAAEAFRSQGRFLADPVKAVEWIAARIKPAAIPDPKRLNQLIADLDSPEFEVRDRATKELRECGTRAAAALREAVNKSESLEVRRRAGSLLADLENTTTPPEELRALRTVEILEWIDTPEGRKLLRDWAKGAPGAALTEAAETALRRLSPP